MASRRMQRTKSFSSYVNSLNSDINNLKSINDVTSLSAGAITGNSFSEDITLFGSSIKSSDYVGGESGWKIDSTGVAEFADVYVRGDINAQTGTIGYWNISSPGVVRRIGPSTQFGTFLESENVGPNDDSKTSGVYVGLFKSYFENAIPITSRRRVSNVATITVVDGGFEPGDRVVVDLTEDTSYNNGGLPVTIIAVTGDSISYINTGSDFPAAGALDTTDTTSSGTVTFYNPDIAGLYIKDYGKADIDYGYFSSAGLAFVSGSRINLIYNPSFEYFKQVAISAISGSGTTVTYTASGTGFTSGSDIVITGAETDAYNITGTIAVSNVSGFTITSAATGPTSTATASSRVYDVSNWNYAAATTNPVTAIDFRSTTNSYQTSSVFGGYASWTNTMSSSYTVQGTIAYSKGLTYNLFSNDRVLTLRYDSFVDYTPYSAVPTTVSANTTTMTITTSGAHGMTAGDLVYCDFTGVGDSAIYGPGELLFSAGTYTVTAAPTNTTFRINNPLGDALSSPMPPVAISPRTAKVFHVPHPAVPLDQISFKFSNGTSTAISNVINDITAASWVSATSNNKFLHQTVEDWMGEYLSPTVGIAPLKPESGDPIYIDAEKLRLEYARLDPDGLEAKSNITILLPAAVYEQTANAASSLTNDLTTSTIAYMDSAVSATALSGNGTTVTVTATNNFAAGDLVTITGASTAAYNTIINLPIATASSTSFTVNSSATGTTSTATARAYKPIKHIFDGISLSTESVAFYGDSSSDYSWEDPTLNSTAQISVQDPKKWLDIDLATQTGSISNLDYISLKQSRLNIPMLAQPSIEADSSYSSDIGSYFSPSYEYENLKLSSGITSVLGIDGSTYYNYESKNNIATSRFKAVNQLSASLSLSTGTEYVASLSAEVTSAGLRSLIVSGTLRSNANTVAYSNADKSGVGIWLHQDNYIAVSRSNGIPMYIKRQLLDGVLVSLNALGTQQGSISVSGTTVSYNTFLGSHYSEMSDTVPLKGTIMESINELVEDRYVQQDRMPKVKVSDSAGSRKVYGVYLGVDHDENDEERGHLIAAIGAGWVRIASGLTVEPGDLVESNGDGCGRAQADDVIRSSTVGKVTSNVAVSTYEDGSYLVPCVLYCG